MTNSTEKLNLLLKAYSEAPEIFQAGRYWKAYENKIVDQINQANLDQLRSGKYPIFGTFGFSESVFHYPPHIAGWKKAILKLMRSLSLGEKIYMPYNLNLKDVQEMAFHHCLLAGELAGVKSIREIETSTIGLPGDLFEVDGKKYTLQFLSFYLRYCFAQSHLRLKGNEVIVELGTGSGFQIEVLKKIHPELTILCFDLPAPLYLCEYYLGQVFNGNVVGSEHNLDLQNLVGIKQGKIHFFGNWQFGLLKDFKFDVFWNAASFGEMEPHIVENYLSYVKGKADYIYLLQARSGKESSSAKGVEKKIRFENYMKMLSTYSLIDHTEVFQAHRRLSQSGGYFQGVWKIDEN